jgi:predicted lipoprotein with Yx(FWY)xxD motif
MTSIGLRTPAALVATALVLGASACGSSSKSTTSTSSASASPTTSTASSGGYRSNGGSSTAASTTPAATSGSAAAVTVSAKSSKLGQILAAGPKHKTVYLFEGDTASASTCNGACATVWPPVTGTATASGGAMSADLGTITRSDGAKQVTYKGHPLYFYGRDGDAGDAYGQGIKSFGADWYVLSPSGEKVDKS